MDNYAPGIEKENKHAAGLLKLSVAIWAVPNIAGLFKFITCELAAIIDFKAADLMVFADEASAKHARYHYKDGIFSEFPGVNDPLFFAAGGRAMLGALFTPGVCRQINSSYWAGRVPHDSLFYKKEAEYAGTWYIPFFRSDELVGFFQFRTDSEDGFSNEDQDALSLTAKILSPRLYQLLHKSPLESSTGIHAEGLEKIKLGLFAFSNEIAAVRNNEDLDHLIREKFTRLLPDAGVFVYRTDNGGKSYRHAAGTIDLQGGQPDELKPDDKWIDGDLLTNRPHIADLKQLTSSSACPALFRELLNNGWSKASFAAIDSKNRHTGLLIVCTKDALDVPAFYADMVVVIAGQLSIALNNLIINEKIEEQFDEIKKYRQRLEVENNYLQEEIASTFNYSNIVGLSAPMQKVFHLVSQVAETQSSVLILGETGTGKELIARAIHNASPRKKKLMVKLNCAALPASLIESELFGHEKGSFTGATERRIGKFELANNSTLFLDEIGELPPDLQVKLLRALQEREIERVGGSAVIKVNVRIVAATNRNLLQEVQAGNFRSDLYFRLNVFPVILPPLRDRKDDIPLLANHFLTKHVKKGMRRISGFSAKVLKQLMAYDWPGNVRELEHLVERCILLATGPVINQMPILLTNNEDETTAVAGIRIKTIDEIEREHIMMVLKKCRNKVAGIGGAADVLQIPASTLNSKMRRLNIKRTYKGE